MKYPNSNKWHVYAECEGSAWNHAEICFIEELKNVPSYINTVIMLGCGGGRNFLPYIGKYITIGIDLHDEEDINWICKPNYYYCLSVEDFIDTLKDYNLSKTLMCGSGILMYLGNIKRKEFYDMCIKQGCKNFIFQEYAPGQRVAHECFDIEDTFELKRYRPELTTYIKLDKSNDKFIRTADGQLVVNPNYLDKLENDGAL